MIRSLFQYVTYFLKGFADPGARVLISAHARDRSPDKLAVDDTDALNAVADHFMRAQDQGNDAGLGSFHLIRGWSASYPETTGYIIPTLLALSDRLVRPELADRAVRAADWLLRIQFPEGGWQGGRVDEKRPWIVFNTAQVIRGLLAVHDHTRRQAYLDAAVKAADRIVAAQEQDGSWVRHNFLQRARVYDSYVSAPLLHLHQVTAREEYRASALRGLEWVLSRQHENGWFADADNTIKHNGRPITHTIAYTLDGLLESHAYLHDERLLLSARIAADVLLSKFQANGKLFGRYDRDWNGSELPICTGNAQLAIVWARLHAITGEAAYGQGLQEMVRWLKFVQQLSFSGPVEVHGAVPGSFPLWGRYEKFAFPNWAQKYFADAVLCAEGRLPRY